MLGREIIRMLSTRSSRAENPRTTAKANVAVDLAPPGRISVGGEVPGEHLCTLARITAWMVGAVLSALIPAITLHMSRGLLNSAEDLALVSVQFLLTACFTVHAARYPGRRDSNVPHSGRHQRTPVDRPSRETVL
jgi:hypothetical protein